MYTIVLCTIQDVYMAKRTKTFTHIMKETLKLG